MSVTTVAREPVTDFFDLLRNIPHHHLYNHANLFMYFPHNYFLILPVPNHIHQQVITHPNNYLAAVNVWVSFCNQSLSLKPPSLSRGRGSIN